MLDDRRIGEMLELLPPDDAVFFLEVLPEDRGARLRPGCSGRQRWLDRRNGCGGDRRVRTTGQRRSQRQADRSQGLFETRPTESDEWRDRGSSFALPAGTFSFTIAFTFFAILLLL